MISLLLLFLTIIVSGIFERIGAIALELTGMPKEQAEFQALSAFSGVGFTTKEAEFAIGHPQRRKIIAGLINFGSAGIITTLITLGGTLLSGKSILETFSRDPKYSWMPFNFPTMILIFFILLFYLISRWLKQPSTSRFVKELVSAALLKTKIIKPLSFHEVLVNGNGYGIFQVEISDQNPLAGKSSREAGLEEQEIKLLYVNRLSESINAPDRAMELKVGDVAAFYGPIAAIYDNCVDLREEEKKEDGTLEIGTQAPEFTLKDQKGKDVSLSDFKGRANVVLVFYPKDKSFFCSAQLKALSDHLSEMNRLDTQVLAINQESMKSHAGFCDFSNLKFPLLSDPEKKVCKSYLALMFGGLLVDRTVYILDKQGVIRYAQRGKPAITEILGVLKRITT